MTKTDTIKTATSERLPKAVFFSVFLLLVCLSFVGCKAPTPVLQAEDLATQIEDEYVSAVSIRLAQWRDEIAHSWEKELRHVLNQALAEKADESGRVSIEDVISLIDLQGQAREKNIKRLKLEAEADMAATAAWGESRRIRASVRRWLEAGMTQEQRDAVYRTVIKSVSEGAGK